MPAEEVRTSGSRRVQELDRWTEGDLRVSATWGSRRRGAAVGFTVITALNVGRLGHLSLLAENRALLDVLHLYVRPGILILVAAGFVYAWMGRQGFDVVGGPPAVRGGGSDAPGAGGLVLGAAARRFLLLAALLVAAYFAPAPLFYERARSSTSSRAGSR